MCSIACLRPEPIPRRRSHKASLALVSLCWLEVLAPRRSLLPVVPQRRQLLLPLRSVRWRRERNRPHAVAVPHARRRLQRAAWPDSTAAVSCGSRQPRWRQWPVQLRVALPHQSNLRHITRAARVKAHSRRASFHINRTILIRIKPPSTSNPMLHDRYGAALKHWVAAQKRIEAAEEKIRATFLERTFGPKAERGATPSRSDATATPPKQPPKK